MIISFGSQATEDIYHGLASRQARTVPESIWPIARRKLDMINAASIIADLRIPPGNRLERLRGDLSRFHSIRINDQYRIIFEWIEGHAKDVQIIDYH